jgi:hypothetical protein
VVAAGVGLPRAERFGEADDHHPDGRASRGEVVGEPDAVWQPERRQPGVDVADDRHALFVQVERDHGEHAGEHGDERTRHSGRDLAQDEHDRQRAEPDGERAPLGVVELGEHVPRLLEEVALLLLDPEQLRELADDDRQGEPDDESLEDRFGDEVGDEAHAQHARGDGKQPDHQREHDREGGELVGIARHSPGDQVGHDRGGQRRGGRHRARDEVLGAAECGV